MIKKFFALFVIYLLFASSITIGVVAEPPAKSNPYPENGRLEEQEKWILENPNLFNPENPSQKEAFRRAYEKGSVKYPNQIEATTRYVNTFKDGILNNPTDRRIVSEFVAYSMKKTADLKEGSIRISFVQSQTYIITSDNIAHDILQLSKIQDLIGIRSKPDGTIELIMKNKGEISLKDTSLTLNENGEFVTSNNQKIKLEDNNAGKKVFLGYDDGLLKVSCEKGCTLSKGYATITLNDGGSFKDFGSDNFLIENGNTRLGQNLLAGKYQFSLNIEKDGHTTLNLKNRVELFKFNDRNSFMILDDPIVADGKLHFGNVEIATGSGKDKVLACFDCKDKPNLDSYDGYVKFEPFKNSNCNYQTCETVYKAEIKGLVAAKFEKDAFHEGFDKNLLVSYYDNGKDNKGDGIGVFNLESCKGCKVGKDAIVGVQTLNNNFLQIHNNYYSDDKKEPQLRYKYIGASSQVIPYLHYAKFNKEGINFNDNDVYKTGKLGDTLYTGLYKSDTLVGRDTGVKSIRKYLEEYYKKDFELNPRQADRKVNDIFAEILNNKYSRNLYVVDTTAYNFDKNGKKINAQNLYVTTKDGNVVTDQLQAVESGLYANFFQRQSTKEIIDILNKKGLTGKERQDEFERLSQLKSDEIFIKTRLQFLSSVIDGGRAIKEETPSIFKVVRELLQNFPREEAEKRIRDYNLKYEGAKKIFEMRSNGISLEEIYKTSGSSPEIKAAFQEPFLVHRLNQEIIVRASPEQKVNIYYLENGELKTKSVDIGNANRMSSSDTARAYAKDSPTHFSDTRLAVDILSAQIASGLTSEKDKEVFQKYAQNIIQANKLHLNSRYQDGTIYLTKAGLAESNYIKFGEDRYFVASSEIIQMIKDEKLDFNIIRELSEINQIYQQDARAKQLKYFADALVPRSIPEVALNLGTEIGILGKGAVAATALLRARSLIPAARAYGGLIGNFGLATVLGGTIGGRAEVKALTRTGESFSEAKTVFRAVDSKDERAVLGVGTYVAETPQEARKYGTEIHEFVLSPDTRLLVVDSSNEPKFLDDVTNYISKDGRQQFLELRQVYGDERALEMMKTEYAKSLGYDGIDGNGLGLGIVVFEPKEHLLTPLSGLSTSYNPIPKAEIRRILLSRPESIRHEMESGDILVIVPLAGRDDSTLLKKAENLAKNNELHAGVSFRVEVHQLDNGKKEYRLFEERYNLPESSDFIHFKGDENGYIKGSADELSTELFGMNFELEWIVKNIESVDLEKSFPKIMRGRTFQELSKEEQLQILNLISDASAFRTTLQAQHMPSIYGDIVWIKERGEGYMLDPSIGIAVEDFQTTRSKILKSGLLPDIDLKKMGVGKSLDEMTRAEKDELMFRLAQGRIHSSQSEVISHASEDIPFSVHTHPADIFDTGSESINKFLQSLFKGPYRIKLTSIEAAALSATKEVTLPELKRSLKKIELEKSSYQVQLDLIEKSDNPRKFLVWDRESLAKQALETDDPNIISLVDNLLEEDGLIKKVGTDSPTIADPKSRVEEFLRNKEQLILDPNVNVDRFRYGLTKKRDYYESLADRAKGMIDFLESGKPIDKEMFFLAIEQGTIKPSLEDLASLVRNPKRQIELDAKNQIKIGKIVYPHGMAYYIYEPGEETVKVITNNGREYISKDIPIAELSELLRTR